MRSAHRHLDRPAGHTKVDETGAGVQGMLLEARTDPAAGFRRVGAQEHEASPPGPEQLAGGQVGAGRSYDALDLWHRGAGIEPPVEVPRARDAAVQRRLIAFLQGAMEVLGVGAD